MDNNVKPMLSKEISMLAEKLSVPHQFLIINNINMLLYGDNCRKEERRKKISKDQSCSQ